MQPTNNTLMLINELEADDSFPFPPTPHWVRIAQIVVYITEFILGIGLNSFLILLIMCRKLLHQRGFAVMIQILIVNLAFTIPVLSTCAHVAVTGEWNLGDSFCQFIAFCNESFQPQRWFLTAVLVIDRAFTIHRPLKYEKYGTKVVAVLSTSALSFGLLIGVLPPITPDLQTCNGFAPGSNTCHVRTTNSSKNCGRFLLGYTTITILLGGVLPFCLYLWMACKARKVSRQVVPSQQVSKASFHTSSLSQKQLVTVFLLFWTLIGCSLPYYFSAIVTFVFFLVNVPKGIIAGYYLLVGTNLLYYGLVIADPIALMWNKDVKQEMRKIKQKLTSKFI